MKVLWFTNTPAAGEDFIDQNVMGGGWLKALNKAIQDHIELHIAYYYPKYHEPFIYEKTHYYPICFKNWKWYILIRRFFTRFFNKQENNKYVELIDKINPEIIHIFGSENAYGGIINHISIPVIISLQGIVTVIYHKYFTGIEKKYLSVKNNRFKQNIISAIIPKSFKNTYIDYFRMSQREIINLSSMKYIIGRTDWDRRVSSILAPNSTYFHVDEILRTGFYANQWIFKNNEPFIVHTTIANSFFKGFEILCLALYELNAINTALEWRVVGINENDLIVKIVKKKLGNKYPKKGLVLLGHIGEQELIESLLEANLYVMTSHIENSSNSLCEAMLLGMPCIATFAGGTGSILQNGKEGILIQNGDPWALAGAILELKRNPELVRQYSKRARERALIRHKPETIVREQLKVYKHIISKEHKY